MPLFTSASASTGSMLLTVGTGSTTVNSGTLHTVAWTNWADTAVIASAATTVWANWVVSGDTCCSGTYTVGWPTTHETPAERQAREMRQAAEALRLQAEERARQAKRAAAETRAERLLRYFLSEEQRKQLAEKAYFELDVHSKDGGLRRYRINRGRAGNIQLLDGGKPREILCVHPADLVPDADTMVAQLLALQADEEGLRRTANIRRVA